MMLAWLLFRWAKMPFRGVLLYAGVLTASFMFMTNQLLSSEAALTGTNLKIVWGVTLAALLLWSLISPGNRNHYLKHWRRAARRRRAWLRRSTAFSKLALCIVALVFGLTLVIASVALPNNHDSMTYHLPRIMHWVQNAQVSIFQTNIDRQIYQHPGAEHLQLQFFLLLDGDGGALNVVQWFALLGCVLAAGLIAKELGGKGNSQWLAMAMVATVPMAIMQSTGTKNDLLLACMMMVGIWQIVRIARLASVHRVGPNKHDLPDKLDKPSKLNKHAIRQLSIHVALLVCLSLGWVLLVKGTGYVYLPPLMLGLCLAGWKFGGVRVAAKLVALACAVTVGMMALPWFMNQLVFGSVLGPVSDGYRPSGNLFAAGVINAVRCVGSQLTTPVESVNQLMLAVMTHGLGVFGLDINDARSMNYGDQFFLFGRGFLSEDHAGSPWQMFWILVALPVLAWRGRGTIRTYVLLWFLAAAMFCVLVSWNQWINRLTLPLMITALPLVGIALRFENWRPRFQRALLLGCLIMATPALLFNYNRSLLGSTSVLTHNDRQVQLLANPAAKSAIDEAVAQIRKRGIRNEGVLGLVFSMDELEYPFWQELVWNGAVDYTAKHPRMRLVHRGVTNDTARLDEPSFSSAATIKWLLVSKSRAQDKQMVVDDRTYHRVWLGDGYALYQLGVKSE